MLAISGGHSDDDLGIVNLGATLKLVNIC